ncbi:MAG TPA: phosphoglycerate mutase family protein [Candidatus Acidoferrum sp.]|nr:phosphoglycerate mutase family protein [Candidatus Acidoferrum sp.]
MPTLFFIRHAKAGSRIRWEGNDRERPLTKSGRKQAEDLVSLLGAYPITAVWSSPYLRCVQSVEPIAKAFKLKVQETRHLAEGARLKGAYRFIEDPDLEDTVLCTHGDVIMELVDDLIRRRLVKTSQAAFDKGSTWAVEIEDGSPVGARYIPAP